MEFHVHLHIPELYQLMLIGDKIMTALTDLRDKVEANTTVIESAIALIQGLKTKLDEAIASGDPAQIQALSDSLGAETQKLADAVAANTLV